MRRPTTPASAWPFVCAGLLACGPSPGTTDATSDSTDATTASSTSGPTSSDEPTSSTDPAPTTTSTSTTASTTTSTSTTSDDTGATTEPTSICETCTPDEICVQLLDEHTCGFPGEGNPRCVPNPHGCVPSDPCSIACHDVCGPDFCEGDPMCSTAAGALQCWSYQGQSGWNCDPFARTDCVAGKKCVPFADDRTRCAEILEPSKQPGEACEGPDFAGTDDCAAGSVCFSGSCVALCSPIDLACADPATTCVVDNPQVGLCLPG